MSGNSRPFPLVRHHVAPLSNNDTRCYMNAVVQVLASCPNLCNALHGAVSDGADTPAARLLHALRVARAEDAAEDDDGEVVLVST